MTLLALPFPADAGFRYVPPPQPRPGYTEAPAAAQSLLGALRKLVPPEIVLRVDRRIDAERPLTTPYSHWQTLIYGEGLVIARHGAEWHVLPAGINPEDVELVTPVAGRSDWQLRSGEFLSDALVRWGRRAGCRILILTDRRWRIDQPRRFRHMTFEEALRAVMFGLAHLPHPPAAEMTADRSTLVVTHRVRPAITPPPDESGKRGN